MKPASRIESWKDWPEDVVETMRSWNHTSVQRLRFPYTQGFTCADCGAECVPNRYGDAALDGHQLCDDCLITIVRNHNLLRDSMQGDKAFLAGTIEGLADLAAGRYDIVRRPNNNYR